MKIRRYMYSCMFDMPSQKPVQQYNYKNIQNSKTSNSNIFNTYKDKGAKHAIHYKTKIIKSCRIILF